MNAPTSRNPRLKAVVQLMYERTKDGVDCHDLHDKFHIFNPGTFMSGVRKNGFMIEPFAFSREKGWTRFRFYMHWLEERCWCVPPGEPETITLDEGCDIPRLVRAHYDRAGKPTSGHEWLFCGRKQS